MKIILILFNLLILAFIGCNKDENNPITPLVEDDRIPFEINFTEYSENNFFIDTVYANTSSEFNMFNLYYGSTIPTIQMKYFIKDIEVYKSINTISEVLNSIVANAYITLPSRTSSNMYPDALRESINNPISGQEDASRFQRLNEGSDYIFHSETGYITFLFPISKQDVIAAAYRIENDGFTESDDLFYGEFMSELVNNSKTHGVLKLIKPKNLQPTYRDAWKLKLKNIYKIDSNSGWIDKLDLDIYFKTSDATEVNKINGVRLLELFGLDKFDAEGNNNPDGIFDGRVGLNYNPSTSEIIFPVLEPFGNNLPSQLDDSLKYEAIYDTTKSTLNPINNFIIKGKYRPR